MDSALFCLINWFPAIKTYLLPSYSRRNENFRTMFTLHLLLFREQFCALLFLWIILSSLFVVFWLLPGNFSSFTFPIVLCIFRLSADTSLATSNSHSNFSLCVSFFQKCRYRSPSLQANSWLGSYDVYLYVLSTNWFVKQEQTHSIPYVSILTSAFLHILQKLLLVH